MRVSLGDADGKEYADSEIDYNDIVIEEDGLTELDLPFHVSLPQDNLLIHIAASGDPIAVSTYQEIDDDGNTVYDGLELHFTVKTVAAGTIITIFIFLYLLAVLGAFFVSLKQPSEASVFILVYFGIGMLFFIFLPMLIEPDAGNHFKRIFAMSEGQLYGHTHSMVSWLPGWSGPDGDAVYISHYDFLCNLHYHIDSTKYIDGYYTNIALYSPISYLVPTLGMRMARLFTTRLEILVMAARLFNYLATGIIMTLAVIVTPFGKKYLIWISLLPLMLQQFVSVSPDPMVVALVSLLTALVFRLRYDEQATLCTRYIAGIYLTCFLLGQYKIVYVVMCLLLLLVPKDKFKDTKNYCFHIVTVACTTLIPALIWLHISSGLLSNNFSSSSEQTASLIHAPWQYAVTLLRTLIHNGYNYFTQMFGRQMGALKYLPNTTLMLLLLIVMLITVTKENTRNKKPDFFTTIVVSVTVALQVLLIFTAEYIQWTSGTQEINGVQGRYMFPVLFPLLLLICGKDEKPAAHDMPAGKCKMRIPSEYLMILIDLCFLTQTMVHYIFHTS